MVLGKLFMHPAAPNTALIRFSGRNSATIVLDGPMFAIPVIQRVYSLPLRLRPITVHTSCATSRDGVDIDLTSFCKVKIHSCLPLPTAEATRAELETGLSAIRLAAQSFTGKSTDEIQQTIQYIIVRHQRAVIGVLTLEEIYRNRAVFSQRVLDSCHDDMRKMGLAFQAYIIVEIADDKGYIKAVEAAAIRKLKRRASARIAKYRAQIVQERTATKLAAAVMEQGMIDLDKHRQIAQSDPQKDFQIKSCIVFSKPPLVLEITSFPKDTPTPHGI